jgi:hypothetical protein
VFPNLVPLSLELHNGLKREQEEPDKLKPELKAISLKESAETYFRAGQTTRSYGCLRLAYALSRHFHKRRLRQFEMELELAAQALYFLRRSTGWDRETLTYSALNWLLERELLPTLQERKVLPPFGRFCLLIELGSWLSESKPSTNGLDLLIIADSQKKDFRHHLRPTDMSRFQRQLANGFLQQGQYGKGLQGALRLSQECGDVTENNKIAIMTTQLNLHLSKNEIRKSLDIAADKVDYAEKQTGYFYGDLRRLDTSVQTALALIAQSMLAQGQLLLRIRGRQNLQERLAALRFQEEKFSVMTRLDRIPNLHHLVDQSAQNLPELRNFVAGRLSPALPQESIDLIIKVATRLT